MNKYNKALALPNEVWENVFGYENLYQASSMGNMKSLNYNKTGKEKILKPIKSSNGYLKVVLCKDGKCKQFYVHRLVAEAFLNNPDNLPCINHLDENKFNNHYSNLEFCSYQYNNNYGTHNERMAKTKTKPVQGVDPKTGKVVVEFSSIKEAGRNGFDNSAISRCCLGKQKVHHGLIWRYK